MSKTKPYIDSSFVDKAIIFATNAHKNVERKCKGFPYIIHPLEAMVIVSTMTNDPDLLAAAALHDVIEDTDYTYEDLKREFNEHVANIVQAESDVVFHDKSDKDSWKERKEIALARLKNAPKEVKIVALGDKLSNMRAIDRDYRELKEVFFQRFHVTDPKVHSWRYHSLVDALSELQGLDAFEEFKRLVNRTFPED